MSESLRESDERILRGVVIGELELGASEVRERRAASPALARALEEWARTGAGLERVRAEDERLLASARAEVTEADRELVAAALARHAQAARRPGFPSRRLVSLGAVAATVLAVLLWAVAGRDRGPKPTILLGDDACVRPRGAVAAYSPFVIDRELDPFGGELEIVVEDEQGVELLRSDGLASTTWELTAEQAAVLRDVPSIRWRYELYDRILDAWDGGECAAWLSP